MGISHDFTQPGESLQRLKRDWTDEFTDQHGRRFAAQYDLGNMRPIGELVPVDSNPPWLPPMFYIRWPRPKGGFRFRWDYDALANELVGTSVGYYAEVMDFMLEHMKDQPIPELGDPVPPMVLRSPIGKPPLSPAIVLACQAGDPWALGVPGAAVNQDLKLALEQSATNTGRAALILVRERMAKMVGDAGVPTQSVEDPAPKAAKSINDTALVLPGTLRYEEFVASCRSRGSMKMDEIVSAWREHKANVAAEKAEDAQKADVAEGVAA